LCSGEYSIKNLPQDPSVRKSSKRWLYSLGAVLLIALYLFLIPRLREQQPGSGSNLGPGIHTEDGITQKSLGNQTFKKLDEAPPGESQTGRFREGEEAPKRPSPNDQARQPDQLGAIQSTDSIALSGVVRSSDTKDPVSHAVVHVFIPLDPPINATRRVSENGTFKFDLPAGYRYEIKSEAEGFKSKYVRQLTVERPFYDLEILMEPMLFRQLREQSLIPRGYRSRVQKSRSTMRIWLILARSG